MSVDYQAKVNELKLRFVDVNEALGRLMERRAEIERQITDLQAEQLRMQGEYRVYEDIKKADEAEKTGGGDRPTEAVPANPRPGE